MRRSLARLAAIGIAISALYVGDARAQDSLLVQSTTSTRNSGLYDWILPKFTAASGIQVLVVAVGTGQALRNARDGNADLLIVHDPAREEAFVAAGWGLARHPFMYNDFVLAGPEADPAGVESAAKLGGVSAALRRIRATNALFASRGDDSGTHTKELALWAEAGEAVDARAPWYLETGRGMGETLNLAVEQEAYVLTDRASWVSSARRTGMRILVEGDPRLLNQYSAIVVNPTRHPHVQSEAAERFVAWLLSAQGREAVASFRLRGEAVFFSGDAQTQAP